MTLEELMGSLVEHGFVRNDPATPAPDPEPAPAPEPAPQPSPSEDAISALRSEIAELTRTIKANAIKTNIIETPQPESAEDILGALLVGDRR